ncbi:hypothetical protein PoB_002677800 [Plakobranchus ocellatus]|uniref:CARMIL C-terminal domain-containing protein n=1 Tax=Plakobranchus ocellatus TaxID=259542 RepID=A0AAV4A0L6_9GAST|nr:hypothetical protein PoB_002677800 [Plakobranchus ocellatus]
MSSHQKPNSDTTRPKQRHIKLNPVSAPGLKPVTPPPALSHLEYTPPAKREQPKTHVDKQENSFQALGNTSKSHHKQSSIQNRRKGEKAGELTLLSHADSRVSPSPPSIFPSPVPPSPTSPLSPPTETTQFAGRRRKTKQSSRFDLFSPEKQRDDEVENLYTDSGSFGGVSRPIREHHIQLPHSRDSRSPSPMSRRVQMTGNTLGSINSATTDSTDAIFGSGSERRRRSASRGSSLSLSSSQRKGATTATTNLTTSGNVCKKSTDKIDISYSPVCPLSPRKRQGPANDNTSNREPFQENYSFFLKGGPTEEKEDDDNNNNERVSRIFSPAPVRDIFSPMPSTSSCDTSCQDLLDSCVELKVSRGGLKEGKRGSNSGVVFPAIRVENVDDKTNRSGEPDFCSIGGENVADNSGAVISGRRSKSVTSSSTSSPSTSPSPTSTSPTEFLRYKPTRTKSTNTLLSAEASSVIDSWLSPTLSPTPPPSSTQTRHHPENARLNWRKCGSSSTSCLLSVPTPLVKRQTAEGRVIVGVPDALAVPGDGGAGRKGMMSRGWSRSESNLFVRTGRPVGGAGEGGMRTDEDFEEDLGEEGGRKGSVRARKSSRQLYPGTAADNVERDANKHVKTITHSTQPLLEHQNQELRKPLSPPTFVTPDKADVDFPSLTLRPVSGPRPPYRGSKTGGQ